MFESKRSERMVYGISCWSPSRKDEDCENITAPLVVVASITKSEFKEKYIKTYTFEVSMYYVRVHMSCNVCMCVCMYASMYSRPSHIQTPVI